MTTTTQHKTKQNNKQKVDNPESRETPSEASAEPGFVAVKLKSAASQSKLETKPSGSEGSAFGEVKLKKASEQP